MTLRLQNISQAEARFADDRTGDVVAVTFRPDEYLPDGPLKGRAIFLLRSAATILLTSGATPRG